MTQPLDANHALTLFLGDGPAIVVESGTACDDARKLAQLPDRSVGSILVKLAHRRRSDPPIRALLADCHRALADDGRLAVVLENRWEAIASRIRTRSWRGSGPAPGPLAAIGGVSLGTVLRALAKTGFGDVSTLLASPSADDPSEVRRPSSKVDLMMSPGFLVTAGKSGSVGAPVVERMAERVGPGAVQATVRPTVSFVANSQRGKSIVFIEGGARRSVIRVARSRVARRDEAKAHALLGDLRRDARVANLVAAPLARGIEGTHAFFAESHADGQPLARHLSAANRPAYLFEVERFLKMLNGDLDRRPVVPLDRTPQGAFFRPMLERVLEHLRDAALRADARALIDDSLRGAHSRLGTVHGDFGTSNILASDGRITAVVDWEAARRAEPPVLDAINYLDSAHRTCNPDLTIVETVPMLMRGDWPVPEEHDFLERFLRHCGIDRRFRSGFALLYLVFHIGPQLRFAQRETGPARRLEQVFRRVLV
mgnify:CR=1 FL=1